MYKTFEEFWKNLYWAFDCDEKTARALFDSFAHYMEPESVKAHADHIRKQLLCKN